MKKWTPIKCLICSQDFNSSSFRWHVKTEHGMNVKSYYDQYLKREGEGVCHYPGCKKETLFNRITTGYRIGCCNKHAQLSSEVKDRVRKGFQKKYGVDFYNNRDLARKTCVKRYGVDNVSKSKAIAKKKVETNLRNRGVRNPLQDSTILSKIQATNLQKYGCPWNINSPESLKKRKATFLKKYGVDNIIKSEYFRLKMEEDGQWLPRDKAPAFYLYRRAVLRETKRWVKRLFLNWDGTCYYTGVDLVPTKKWKETCLTHPSSNLLQPTVDHQVSIYSGFLNNIKPETIGHLNNLCICSRSANSLKRINNDWPKYGFDFHGVCDKCPSLFKELSEILVGGLFQVHIITGSKITPEFIEKLRASQSWTTMKN